MATHQNIHCLKQLTILALTTFYRYPPRIFLTYHYLLSSKIQHRLLIDMDIFHLPGAKPEKLCTLPLIFTLYLPAGTICTESARDFVLRKAKIHNLHPSYLYQTSSSLVKGNLSSYSYFFQRHQTKYRRSAVFWRNH